MKREQRSDAIWHLAVGGEMDLYNASQFKREIDELFALPARGVVVDLGDLSYIDSSGVGALLYAFTQSKARSVGVCFANVVGSVRTVLELTSLVGFLPIADSLDAAVERVNSAKTA